MLHIAIKTLYYIEMLLSLLLVRKAYFPEKKEKEAQIFVTIYQYLQYFENKNMYECKQSNPGTDYQPDGQMT